MALPLSITVIFGISHVPDANGVMQHTLKNPNAPSVLTYAWIGPFVGAAVRPMGGWISDKVGGSIVTQVISAVMVVASVAVGYVMMQAYGSATPEQYFPCSWACSCVLFFASGIGNGSTFRTIGVIFDRQQAGPVLGWTSAVAAYGAFIAPVVIGSRSRPARRIRDVRLCRLLRPVPGAELVVLPAQERLREEPLTRLLFPELTRRNP
jgi:NNP family nitrate/nitrite transporter-like MFS transporter